ncbi:MAG: hypothetical protein JWO67_5818 [Streptosporangiaceae bacterium]|nr:hypothetical protein [Streptosporangiaceae bacterium]
MPAFGFEDLMHSSELYAARSAELSEKLGDLVGHAESSDGRVEVEWNQDGLAKIELDPRALRMGASELAETITATAREAQKDLERRAEEVRRDVFGAEGDPLAVKPDAEELQETLADMQSLFQGTVQETTALMDTLRKAFEK